jgi:DegV family protein with EDD domain
MGSIALVTDSTCDFDRQRLWERGVTIVPLHVSLGDSSFLDGVDMDPSVFYSRFAAAGQVARSSQPSVGEFVAVYRELLEHHEAVVSVHISGRLSGTIESAALAAQNTDPKRIRWVDSCQVSVGLGLVVQATAEAIDAGLDLDSVVAAAETAGRNTRVWGVTPSLEVAVKGGRVSQRFAHLADTVELKPIIAFDEEGAAEVDSARLGFHRTLRAMVHKAVRFASGHQVKAAIAHADGQPAAYYVWERMSSLLGAHGSTREIPILQAGAVITSHVGLGTVAVAVRREGGGT